MLVYWGAEPAKFKEVFQDFGVLFFPEVAQPRCLRQTQYPLETGNRLNTNPAIASLTQGIHQASLKTLVYTLASPAQQTATMPLLHQSVA